MAQKAAWVLSLALLATPAVQAQQQAAVESKGQHSVLKMEQVISGHLTELNGRYKLRVAESIFEPGGYIGMHHHAGPGLRCVISGDLTYIHPDKTTVYHPGDCFYESGDIAHGTRNDGKEALHLLVFEILPADLKKSSIMPVPK